MLIRRDRLAARGARGRRMSAALQRRQPRLRLFDRVVQRDLIAQVGRGGVLDRGDRLDELLMEGPGADHPGVRVHLQIGRDARIGRHFQHRGPRAEIPGVDLGHLAHVGLVDQELHQLLGGVDVRRRLRDAEAPAGGVGAGRRRRRADRRQRDLGLALRVPVGRRPRHVVEVWPLAHEDDAIGGVVLIDGVVVLLQRRRIERLVRVHQVVDVLQTLFVLVVGLEGIATGLARDPGHVDVEEGALGQTIAGGPDAGALVGEDRTQRRHLFPGLGHRDALGVEEVLAVPPVTGLVIVVDAERLAVELVPEVRHVDHGRREIVPEVGGQEIVQPQQPAGAGEGGGDLILEVDDVVGAVAGLNGAGHLGDELVGGTGPGRDLDLDPGLVGETELGDDFIHRVDGPVADADGDLRLRLDGWCAQDRRSGQACTGGCKEMPPVQFRLHLDPSSEKVIRRRTAVSGVVISRPSVGRA